MSGFRLCSLVMRIAAVVSSFCVLLAQAAPALSAGTLSLPVSTPAQLDLSSTHKTASAPGNLAAPVIINVGGRSQTVTAGMALTPAQSVALAQVLANGAQALVLATNGNATGGQLVLTPQTSLASLTVPPGVQVVRDFALAPLLVSGKFVNAGTFYAVSTNSTVCNAVIAADSITNGTGGLVSSILPPTLPGFRSAITSLSLTLLANTNIVNHGIISSAADLNLVAGGSILNTGIAGAATPELAAGGAVNKATPNLHHRGLI
jgi:hypothetical protein